MRFRRRRLVTVIALLVAVLVVASWIARQTPAGRGVIAYISSHNMRDYIYVLDITTGINRPLEDTPQIPSLHWLPDGERIGYVSNSDIYGIYAIDTDGGNRQQLSDGVARDSWPDWSPDGQQIVFESDRDGNPELYLMTADGTNLRRLTDNPGDDRFADWSPDGSLITFFSERDGQQDICIVGADGMDLRRLTDSPADDFLPVWSPDGERILFQQWAEEYRSQIYVMNADGSDLRLLFPDQAGFMQGPAWSPDGSQIVFAWQETENNYDLFVINRDGENLRRLTDFSDDDTSPQWSPDGGQIAFVSGPIENRGIFVMNADGSNLRRVTDNPGSDYFPLWQP